MTELGTLLQTAPNANYIDQTGASTVGVQKERVEQMYWLHTRGLTITLPPSLTVEIAGPICRGESLSLLEGQRLAIIEDDSIMSKRFPDPLEGYEYMNRVDIDRRNILLELGAQNMMTSVLRDSTLGVTGCTPESFAIILFGSLSRGLSRGFGDNDPSNIDLSIVGYSVEVYKDAIL